MQQDNDPKNTSKSSPSHILADIIMHKSELSVVLQAECISAYTVCLW